MLPNSQKMFCIIPKTRLWENVTLFVPFWPVFVFSSFRQNFLFPPCLIMFFISLVCDTHEFRCPLRHLNGNYSNSHYVKLVVASWHVLFTLFCFSPPYHTELFPNMVLKTKETVTGLLETLTAKPWKVCLDGPHLRRLKTNEETWKSQSQGLWLTYIRFLFLRSIWNCTYLFM